MQGTASRQTAISQLNIEHEAVRDLIQTLTAEEMTRPDTIRYGLYSDQECSFKDLLAHLITYEAYALEAITFWQRGEAHPVIAAMLSDEESTRIHYAGIAMRSGRTLEQVLDEWERTQSALMTAITAITDAEWAALAPFSTDVPTDLSGILEIILVAPPRPLYRHLPVHIPDSAAYVRSLRRT